MMNLFGRRKIYTLASEINENNVIKELQNALCEHEANISEENYLYWYRRGIQPVLERSKEVRPEICNKVVVNNANLVVTFKNGYFLTKPATYVSRKDDDAITEKVKVLNEYLYTSGKHEADNKTVDWFHTVGVAPIIVMPNTENRPNKPVDVYSLDPRSAFVVYSLNPGNKPIFAVNIVTSNNLVYADVITQSNIYRVKGSSIEKVIPPLHAFAYALEKVEPNLIGEINIIEYEYNSNRMGAFESAIPLMDAINNTESNRQDGIEQFVQSLMVLYNCDLEDGITANAIRQAGLIKLKNVGDNKADVQILSEALDQSQTQTTLDDLYEQMLEKCGVPSSVRDGGSTSDNVGAVYLRSGWAMADTDARNTEDSFKAANKLFDKVFLRILEIKNQFILDIDEFDLCFVRNDMSNLLVKTQAAMNMKELGFAPEIAFEKSGLSSDPINDVELSRKYIDAKWSIDMLQNGNSEEIVENEGVESGEN